MKIKVSSERELALTLKKLIKNLRPTQHFRLIVVALIVGLGTGLSAAVFKWMISAFSDGILDPHKGILSFLGKYTVLLAPAAGGFLVGPLVYYFAREAKGHGVPEVMEAVALKQGRIRPIVVLIKALASAITIGTGGSAGQEGPIVQIGAAFGSSVGQKLKFSERTLKTLVLCGSAAGIAIVFNAPIAGVIFALEVIAGELMISYFSMIVISAVSAAALGFSLYGDKPVFGPDAYGLVNSFELLLYGMLGIVAALVGVGFVIVLYRLEDYFDELAIPEYFKPALGGLGVGLIGFIFPEVLGSGYHSIGQILAGQGTFLLMLGLIVGKIIATSLTIGSGGSGGVFAPALFIGSALGGAFGIAVNHMFPGVVGSSAAYGLVGMAAVFSAAARAPITSMLMVFEMTGDYKMMLPLMLATVISTSFAKGIFRESIYTLKLKRKGIDLDEGQDLDVMERIKIAEVMDKQVDTVPVAMALPELATEFEKKNRHGFPVLNTDGNLFGILSIGDLKRALEKGGKERLTAGDIATTELVTAYPDETMAAAIERMAPRDLSRLPVVDRNNEQKLLGVVRRRDLFKAYQIGLMKRQE